jgi:hypothetical protein
MKILVVVPSIKNTRAVEDVIRSVLPGVDMVAYSRDVGKGRQLGMTNGTEYFIWSVEHWSVCTTRGATFDRIIYLVDPVPEFILEALSTCHATV